MYALPVSSLRVACVALLALGGGCVRIEHLPRPDPVAPPAAASQKDDEPAPEPPEERVARLLSDLKPGMTRPQVEEILGPPTADEMASAGADELATTSYWCVLPDNRAAGRHVVTLLFNTTENPPQLMAVTGPNPAPFDK